MVNSEMPIEEPFEEKFAVQIYMFQTMINDANNHISKPGLDFFWIDFSLDRCKGALELLEENDSFRRFSNDVKMKQLVKSFQETIKKLENVKKEDSLSKSS